ncbi:MAG: efflux RND transporter permease subunit [Bacillota bacterium]
MSFGAFSVENKYVILSLMIAVTIFGLFSMFTLNTQLAPDTNPPTATVVSVYPGALALDVAEDVTEPMEEALATLDGVTDVTSTSQDNLSIIRLTFDYSMDVDRAAVDIQNEISAIGNSLPSSLEEPQVLKFSISDQPIMTIGLDSDTLSMLDLRHLAEKELVYDLHLLEGVASVTLFGGHGREIHVDLDQNRVRAHGLTLDRVAMALETRNVKAPGGNIVYEGKDTLLRVAESLMSVDQLRNVSIPLPDGASVRLGNLGEIRVGSQEREGAYRLNAEEGLALLITKKADFNTVNVAEDIRHKVAELRGEYPHVKMTIASDDSVFTAQMVNNMGSSVLMAIIFTMIVILLFITKLSQSIVVSLSMPLVFLSTLGLMNAAGMELDLVTLSALILSIGFVVDTSVVIVENISSHREAGKDMSRAAIEGTDEIAMPTIAGTTTTLIVLVPLLFVEGFVGEMFRPLSLTLIFAISSSLAVALLMIPLLSVLLEPYRFERLQGWVAVVSEPFNRSMDRIRDGYLGLAKLVLDNKMKTTAIILVLLAASGLFLRANGMEMLPRFDSGVSYATLEMDPGTPLEGTSEAVAKLEDFLRDEKEVVSYDARIGREQGSMQQGDFGVMGTDQAMLKINLTSRKDREETIWGFQKRLRDDIERIGGLNRYVVKEQGGTAVTGTSAPIALKISGQELGVLYHLADTLESRIEEVPGTTNVYTGYNDGYSQISVRLDQDRLNELGLNSAIVSRQIYGRIEGIEASTMTTEDADLLDIRVSFEDRNAADLDYLMDTYLSTPAGARVPLREVALLEEENRANLIERDNLEYSVQVLGFTEGRAFSHVIGDIAELAGELQIPKGYSVEFTGEQATLTDSVEDMVALLSLAIVFVYLLLVPQFKSFVHPLTIMAAIPLIVIGVAPALGLTGKYMSMPVLLGFILLAGTVVNNSILLVAAITGGREDGLDLYEAVERAIRSRYRPIMMTALSDVVGMLPLALQLALGSERFSPLAITVIGGIVAATLLTIVIIPMIYVALEELRERISGKDVNSPPAEDVEPAR